MKNETLILGLVGIVVLAIVVVYLAKKGVPVKIGTPLFNAQLN